MQYCNKMKEYKRLSDESFKRCSGAPLLQKENLSPYSTAITVSANSLKIRSKKRRHVTYCLSLKAIQVFTVCILACLSDYQDHFKTNPDSGDDKHTEL